MKKTKIVLLTGLALASIAGPLASFVGRDSVSASAKIQIPPIISTGDAYENKYASELYGEEQYEGRLRYETSYESPSWKKLLVTHYYSATIESVKVCASVVSIHPISSSTSLSYNLIPLFYSTSTAVSNKLNFAADKNITIGELNLITTAGADIFGTLLQSEYNNSLSRQVDTTRTSVINDFQGIVYSDSSYFKSETLECRNEFKNIFNGKSSITFPKGKNLIGIGVVSKSLVIKASSVSTKEKGLFTRTFNTTKDVTVRHSYFNVDELSLIFDDNTFIPCSSNGTSVYYRLGEIFGNN